MFKFAHICCCSFLLPRKGQPVSQTHFTVIGYGPEYTKQTAMEFAADMQFSNLQQFGENFLEQRVQAYRMPLDILERVSYFGQINKSVEAKPISLSFFAR